MNEQNYLNIVRSAILNHIDCEQYTVFLFGSRARGEARTKSDIDVGIWGNTKLPILLRMQLENILEQTSQPLKIDLVDFATLSPEFKKEALTHIQVWNLSKNTELV